MAIVNYEICTGFDEVQLANEVKQYIRQGWQPKGGVAVSSNGEGGRLMSKREVGPNVKCRIIGSQRGPEGSSVGKIVNVVSRADPPTHIVWGPMWDVESLDGKPFKVIVTSPDMQTTTLQDGGMNAVCAEDWLEPLTDDPEPPKVAEKERELTN
jgi:hypothetical protein